MAILKFERVDPDVEQETFDCGNEYINGYIRESYYPDILQDAYTFRIIADGKIVGYYQILFHEVVMSDFPEEIADYDSEIKDHCITAVHIRFLAIRKEYQRHGLGTYILETIIERINQLADNWPIRVITIDAVINLDDWYKGMGFETMLNNTLGQDGVTDAMYYSCIRRTEELQRYIDSFM